MQFSSKSPLDTTHALGSSKQQVHASIVSEAADTLSRITS